MHNRAYEALWSITARTGDIAHATRVEGALMVPWLDGAAR